MVAVTHKYIHMAKGIALINEPLYYYTVGRRGSLWNTPSKKLFTDGYELGMQRILDLECWGYDCSYQRALLALFFLAHEGRDGERGQASDLCIREMKEPR